MAIDYDRRGLHGKHNHPPVDLRTQPAGPYDPGPLAAEPPPTEDPRDSTDPLCACEHPEHAPGQPCDRPGCEPHEYTPHPDTPASLEEHRAAIVAEVKAWGRWPKAANLCLRTRGRLGARFDEMTYAQALASLRLTDAQWGALQRVVEKRGAAVDRRVGDSLAEKGFGSFTSLRRTMFFANDAGRERLALGRGPR